VKRETTVKRETIMKKHDNGEEMAEEEKDEKGSMRENRPATRVVLALKEQIRLQLPPCASHARSW
jgi:hypothetical protein